ncbi:MAG: glycosyl transferase [Clostridia bacterium]|nr:glycosyl transferase [Clostridia bacterium]MBQ5590409.1 glycosyl transferase [Clostridia bacterium]
MNIPKVIHYCWFGKGEMPKLAKKCIKSWKKYCPDYEIVCHNEDNFDLLQNRYMREAYEAGEWAFVSDVARLKIIYDNGGIYLDTDVELIKPIDDLLKLDGFMGFDEKGIVATGLGFGAQKGNKIVSEFLKDYDNIPFALPDGSYDLTPCPDRNTESLKRLGMDVNNKNQKFMDMTFLPSEFLCPMDYYTGKKTITENTYSIHHYSASWTSKVTKRTTRIKRIIGVKMYNKLYGKFLHKFKWLEW